MHFQAVVLLFLLLSSVAPAPAQQLRELAALPQGYTVADTAAAPDGRLVAVGWFTPDDPSRPPEDQGDAFAAAFSPDGRELLFLQRWVGRRTDNAVAVAIDAQGAAYVAVSSASANLVGTPGAWQSDFRASDHQAFLAKLEADGSLAYQTFIGGDANTSIAAVSVRDNGVAAVTGGTSGEGFPTTPGAAVNIADSSAGFVVVLNAEGSDALLSLRGLGGAALTFDSTGNLYGAGSELGPRTVPVTPGAYQDSHELRACAGGFIGFPCSYGYVFALSPDGSQLRFATYLTGDHGSAIESIQADADGNLLIAGSTNSLNFPSAASSKQERPAPAVPVPPIIPPPARGFVAKISPNGSELLFSTLIGGSGRDSLSDMLVGADSIYVAGSAGSYDLPTLSALPQCMPAGFLAELSLEGAVLRAISSDQLERPVLAFGPDTALLAASGNRLSTVDFSASAPRIACVNEAATLSRLDAAAPGSLLSLFGNELASEPLAAEPDANGLFPTSLGGVSVLVGGRPAPLLYVSPQQINLQVPFETELETAEIALDPPDPNYPPYEIEIEARKPAVFLNPAQQDPCASLYPFYWENTPERSPLPLALNEDGTVHSCANPAKPGSYVTLFLTGVGITDPAPVSGAVNTEPPVTISLDVPLEPYIEHALATTLPGSISSVWQVEFQVPWDVHGPLALLPKVGGIPTTPQRIVLWVAPAR
ncbi:MAG: hypothetical protein R2724_23490 [Bryobacterales bacterium]